MAGGWLLSLPFRLLGIVVEGAFELLKAIFSLGLPLVLELGSALKAILRQGLQSAEVPVVFPHVLQRVSAEDPCRLGLGPAQEYLVCDQVGLAKVANIIQIESGRIGKEEIRDYPLLGRAFELAGTGFIDRFDAGKALDALRPAVDALHSGLSITIAPEGTRSPTPRLGRFKKGAFHLAMQAGVPVVPIVFRNTLDALPKHCAIVRPAVI